MDHSLTVAALLLLALPSLPADVIEHFANGFDNRAGRLVDQIATAVAHDNLLCLSGQSSEIGLQFHPEVAVLGRNGAGFSTKDN